MRLHSTRKHRESYEAIEAELQNLAAAGKRATNESLRIVTEQLLRQKQDVVEVSDDEPALRGMLAYCLECLLEDLENYPTEMQLFETVKMSSCLELLIFNFSVRKLPVWFTML